MGVFSLVLKTSRPCATQKVFTSTASRVGKAKVGQQEKDLKNIAGLSLGFFGFYTATDHRQLLGVSRSGRGTAMVPPPRGAEARHRQPVLRQVTAAPGLRTAGSRSAQRRSQREVKQQKTGGGKQRERNKLPRPSVA